MNIRRNLAEVVLDELKDGLELLLVSLPEELLAEKVGHLMHH